jgi:alpha-L-fucosidase
MTLINAPSARPKLQNWHDQVFLGLHYDLHARADDPGLNAALSADHLRSALERVSPDWVQCDAKGHPGYASYPSALGNAAPQLEGDALRIWRDVTHDLGMKLGVHYSGVWDTRAIELHPDWARVDERGQRDANSTCRLSGYESELMIPQLLELTGVYGVDGFWVDGDNWAAKPCWCHRCRSEFERRSALPVPLTSSDAAWGQWLRFHRDLFTEYVTRYADAVHGLNPNTLVCSSWMYSVRQPEAVRSSVDYLSGDYDYSWGSTRASSEARVLEAHGLSWDLMAWTFTKPGIMAPEVPGLPYTLKTALHLKQEVSEVIALGGAIMLYDQLRRDGRLVSWHTDLLTEVGTFCRERQAVCFGTQTASQVAVLHLATCLYAHNDPLFNNAPLAMEGALHALLESQISTDILIQDYVPDNNEQYQVLIVPEQGQLEDELIERLQRFASSGGAVIVSGADLSQHHAAFVGASSIGEAFGVREPSSDPFWEAVFLPVGDRSVPVAGPWRAVTPHAGTQVWQTRQCGPEAKLDTTDQVIVTAKPYGAGLIVAVHGAVFDNYIRGHYPDLRRWIAALVQRTAPVLRLEVNANARLEVIHRLHGTEMQVINLVNRGAGEALHPSRVIVEELPAIHDIELRLRCDTAPLEVRLEPASEGAALEHSHADGLLRVRVPRVDIHAALVLRWDAS